MNNHMQVFDKISKEIDHGTGIRYMAIRATLMKDAPLTLLMVCTNVPGRDIIESAEAGFQELAKRQKISRNANYLVFAFRDAEETDGHEGAIRFARDHGMRLLTELEAHWFKNKFDNLPQ